MRNMLIRSQDGANLFYFEPPMRLGITEIPLVSDKNKYVIMCHNNRYNSISVDSFAIAKYSSEEKATIVLNSIERIYIKSFRKKNKDKPCFYQLPNDDEVDIWN